MSMAHSLPVDTKTFIHSVFFVVVFSQMTGGVQPKYAVNKQKVHSCYRIDVITEHGDTAAAFSTARYVTERFVDGTAASGEPLPGEWRRLVAGDNNLLKPRQLLKASQAALAVRNDSKAYFQTPQGLGRTLSLEEAV